MASTNYTVAVIIVITILYSMIVIWRKEPSFGFVLVWAIIAVVVKQ